MKGNLFLLSFLSLLLSACGSMGTKLDADRAKAVRKVAVLSVEILQQQPKDALGFSKAGELKHGKTTDGPEYQAMGREIANDFNTRLHQTTGWQVVGLDTMIGNPEYARVVKEKMSGLHAVTMVAANSNYDLVEIHGVLANAPFRKLSQPEKVKLARALGADAYAELMIFQNIDQGWSVGNLTGDAAFSFKSRSNLRVFSLDSDKPLWQIQNIDGDMSVRSDSLANKSKVEKLTEIGSISAKSSIGKLLDKYKL